MRVSASSVISSVAETERDAGQVPRGMCRTSGGVSTIRAGRCTCRVPLRRPCVRRRALRRRRWALLCRWRRSPPSRPHRRHRASTRSSLAVYAVGSLICHQLPGAIVSSVGRSCRSARGAPASTLARPSWRSHGLRRAPRAASGPVAAARDARRQHRPPALLIVAIVPTAATLVFEWTTGRHARELDPRARRRLRSAPPSRGSCQPRCREPVNERLNRAT